MHMQGTSCFGQKKILVEDEVSIDVDVNEGEHTATAYGCDLTYDYVKINGDYRT